MGYGMPPTYNLVPMTYYLSQCHALCPMRFLTPPLNAPSGTGKPGLPDNQNRAGNKNG